MLRILFLSGLSMGLEAVILGLAGTVTVGTLIGWFTHWVMHQRWAGKIHISHMTHHLKLYPPQDLLSEKYRNAGADDGLFVFTPVIALGVLLISAALYFMGAPLAVLAIVFAVTTLMGVAHDVLHTSFHLKESRLLRFRWFQYLRTLHFYHHRRMNRNLGIFFFGWDRLFKVFQRPPAKGPGPSAAPDE